MMPRDQGSRRRRWLSHRPGDGGGTDLSGGGGGGGLVGCDDGGRSSGRHDTVLVQSDTM
jgi:hypothetical protein